MSEFPTIAILKERASKMRANPTPAEKKFSARLLEAQIPFKQQFIVAPYIADFIVGNTIIELDGASHDGREEYDSRRDAFLRKAKYQVIRILNHNVERFDLTRLHKASNKKIKVHKNIKLPKKKNAQKYYAKSPVRQVVFNNMNGYYSSEEEFQKAYRAARLECKKKGIKI